MRAMHVVQNNSSADITSLMRPGGHHQNPGEVLSDPSLASHEKRATLSAWASDLYAVESSPWMRDVPGVRITLRLSDILAALRALDGDDDPPPRGVAALRPASGARFEEFRNRSSIRTANASSADRKGKSRARTGAACEQLFMLGMPAFRSYGARRWHSRKLKSE
jgi:hypothetical protein